MKIAKKLAAIAVSSLMVFSIAGMNVFAASTTQDGLEVSLTTDKEAYKKDEKITATLSVKNTNADDVTDVTLETLIPDGYKVANNSSNTKQLNKLASNESAELKVVYVAKSSEISQVSEDSEISEVSEDSIIISDNDIPQTGDNAVVPVAVILALIISVSLAVICFKSQKGRKLLSVILTVSMVGGTSALITVNTNAADDNLISISTSIKLNDSNTILFAKVYYQLSNTENEDYGEIYYSPVDEKHIKTANDGVTMFADNELLVVSKLGVTKAQMEKLASDYNAEIVGYIEKTGDYQWKFKSDNIDTIIQELKNNKLIEEVGYNYIAQMTNDVVSLTDLSDINPGEQYIKSLIANSFNIGSGMWGHEIIKARAVWYLMSNLGIPETEFVNVGLIDSQFYHHEDLGFAEILYETDIDENVDCPEHGTHVAGTMSARGDNTAGICGVYPYANGKLYGVSSIGVQTHSENGSFWSSIIEEKIELSELIFRNVKVINQSEGFNWNKDVEFTDGTKDRRFYAYTKRFNSESPLEANSTYQEFVDYLLDTDFYSNSARQLKSFLDRTLKLGYEYVIVTSAGNDSENGVHYNSKVNSWLTFIDDDSDSNNIYDSYDRIIVVGSVGRQLNISDFSNSGDRVDIYAPGEEIVSLKGENDYKKLQGTSMASPHVAGVAADMFTVNNNLSGAQIKTIIKESFLNESQGDYPVIDALSAVIKATTEKGLSRNSINLSNGAVEGWVFDNTSGSEEYDEETWNGIPNCTIEARRKGEFDVIQATTTDSKGHYELVLPNGTYEVKAMDSSYGEQTISDVIVYDCQITYAEWIVFNGRFSSTTLHIPGEEPIHTYNSNAEWVWTAYDHPNYDTSSGYDKHIIIDGDNIKMDGYLQAGYKDFLYVDDKNSTRRIFELDFQRDQTSRYDSEYNWHSMYGGGFLFNTSINEEENTISGYYILITDSGAELFKIDNMAFDTFRNSENRGERLSTFTFDNRFDKHHIKIDVSSNSVSLYDGEALVIDNYRLAENYGNGFGPITSHIGHDCEQRSYFTFSNITMQTM